MIQSSPKCEESGRNIPPDSVTILKQCVMTWTAKPIRPDATGAACPRPHLAPPIRDVCPPKEPGNENQVVHLRLESYP